MIKITTEDRAIRTYKHILFKLDGFKPFHGINHPEALCFDLEYIYIYIYI